MKWVCDFGDARSDKQIKLRPVIDKVSWVQINAFEIYVHVFIGNPVGTDRLSPNKQLMLMCRVDRFFDYIHDVLVSSQLRFLQFFAFRNLRSNGATVLVMGD